MSTTEIATVVTDEPLNIGSLENVIFKKIDSLPNNINKYQLKATIKPKDTYSYLADYKEELKKRKVVFPGKLLVF
jgi:hypothetical protein